MESESDKRKSIDIVEKICEWHYRALGYPLNKDVFVAYVLTTLFLLFVYYITGAFTP